MPSRRPSIRPLPWFAVVGLLLLAAAASAVTFYLLLRETEAAPVTQQVGARLDAIRTAATITGLAGGALVLILTIRRQRSTEISVLETSLDAESRRNNELFMKAAEQLGSESASTRLAASKALEMLGQENSEYRQIVIDVLSNYLRQPFRPPHGREGMHERMMNARDNHGKPRSYSKEESEALGELRVRSTIQTAICHHLSVWPDWDTPRAPGYARVLPAPLRPQRVAQSYWPGMTLDLSGAALVGFSMDRCEVKEVNFAETEFYETTSFHDLRVQHTSFFPGAFFFRDTWFNDCKFGGVVSMSSCYFEGFLGLSGADLKDPITFRHARFCRGASLNRSQLNNGFSFEYCQVEGRLEMKRVAVTKGTYPYTMDMWTGGFKNAYLFEIPDTAESTGVDLSGACLKRTNADIPDLPEGYETEEIDNDWWRIQKAQPVSTPLSNEQAPDSSTKTPAPENSESLPKD